MILSSQVDARTLTESHVATWRQLLIAAAPTGNAFLSPTFTKAAAAAYSSVRVCLVEDGGQIACILPYQFPSRFAATMRAAERVGEEMNDCFSPISSADFRVSPSELLRLAKLKYLYFTHLPERQVAIGLSGERPLGGLQISLHGGGAAYWASLQQSDAKFAKDTERRQRKATQTYGDLRFSFAETNAAARLPKLLMHKREQYLRSGKGDWLGSRGRRTLLEQLAKSQVPECRGVMSTLSFGDTWAAMHFGLQSQSTLHYWFPVYNPALAPFAPGRLLLHNIILNAERYGVKAINRGVGESQAKNDFPAERQIFYSGAWHQPGLRSFAYRASQSAKWRLAGCLQALRYEHPPKPSSAAAA